MPQKFHLTLLIHAHQPCGNFEHVLEKAYDSSYLPFIEHLEKHPGVRLGLHYSGPLLTWIEKHRPEYFARLKKLVQGGQVELVGGGFYEPILVSIPLEDQREQITRLAAYLEKHFGRLPSEVLLEIGGEAGDLLALIFERNGDEDRFIEAATDEFDLAALDQLFQASEILRAMFLDPGEQRAGIVEAETNSGMLFEVLDEGKIAGVVSLFEDMLEIAAGLVRVNEQSEMEFLRHGDSFFSLTS